MQESVDWVEASAAEQLADLGLDREEMAAYTEMLGADEIPGTDYERQL